MKIFKVIIKIDKMELANGYPSKYYDVNGKICFKVKLFEDIYEYKVKAWSEEAIRTQLKQNEIISINYLEDSENIWNLTAPNNYVSYIGKGELISHKHRCEADQECCTDVQERYAVDGDLNFRIFSEF